MIITRVKHSGRLTEVFSQDESIALVYTTVWKKTGYKEGDTLSEEAIKAVIYDSDYKKAKTRALYLLTSRDYGKNELNGKLQKSVGPEVAQDVCDYMEELGLANDEKYARAMATYYINTKYYSITRATYELIKKGIDRDTAQAAAENTEADPIENITLIIERKYKNAFYDQKIYNRAVNALMRYGYKYGEIKKAFEMLRMNND